MKKLISILLISFLSFNSFSQVTPGGGGITGSGTVGYIPKYTGSKKVGNSTMFVSGSMFTVGSNTTVTSGLSVNGDNPSLNLYYQGALKQSMNASTYGNTYNDIYSNHTVRLINSAPYNNADYRLMSNNIDALFVAHTTALVGIGTISPSAKLDVRGQIVAGSGVVTGNTAPLYSSRASTGSPNYHSGMQYVFEVGGGVWGIGHDYSRNEYQFLTTGSTTSKFIFGTGSSTAPATKFTMNMQTGVFNMASCPTASTGLVTGDIWSDGGTLKIVP